MEKVEMKKVNLSNDGFASFFKEMPVANVEPYYSSINNCIKFKLVSSGHTGQKVIKNVQEFYSYFTRLEEIVSRRRIDDKDKVFFTSGSKFPRTTFNRYSEKARRVQNIDKSTKTVIEIKELSRRTLARTFLGTTDDYAISYFSSSTLMDACEDMLEKHENLNQSSCPIVSFIATARKQWGGWLWQDSEKFHKMIIKYLKDNFSSFSEDGFTFNAVTVKEMETIDLLKEGRPISTFVDDRSVNKYIDSFKDTIDDDSYKMLLSSFNGSETNQTLGLKLLENMDISNSLPYVYALFLNAGFQRCIDSNITHIKYNPIYKSIFIKNMLDNFGFMSDYNVSQSYGNYISKTRRIESVYNGPLKDDKKGRQIYLRLVKKLIISDIEAEVGGKVFKMITDNEIY